MDLELVTYWNVETLALVLNAVSAFMGGNSWQGLLKLAFLIGLAIGMFAWVGAKTLEFGTWFLQAWVLSTLLALPVSQIILIDRTGLQPPRTVAQVPLGLGLVAYTSNLVFGTTAGLYETLFGVPETLTLARGDLGFGHRIVRQTNKAVIREPALRADLVQYIKECVLYDIKDGVISPQELVGGTGTMDRIFDNTNPARLVTLGTLTPERQTLPCTQAATRLKTEVQGAVTAAQAFYGKQAFPRNAADEALAATLFANTLGSSYDWLLGSSANASDALKQAMFNQLWRDIGAELPAALGDTARLQELQSLQAAALAAEQARGAHSTLALFGQEALPHVRNWIEAILFAIFPLVVCFSVVSSTDNARRIVSGYALSLAWVGLWPVMFAVINHLSMMHLRTKLAALGLAQGVPFQLADAFDATVADEQAMIGAMVVAVPFLSGAVIKLAHGGLIGVADKFTATAAGHAASAGASLASGNLSMGQVGADTAALNTTTAQKLDSNRSLMTGGAVVGMSNGDVLTASPNQQLAMTQFSNQLIAQLSAEDSRSANHSRHSGRSTSASSGQQWSAQQQDSASLTRSTGRDEARTVQQSQGRSVSQTASGSQTGAYSQDERLGEHRGAGGSLTVSSGSSLSLGASAHIGGRGSSAGTAAAPTARPSPGKELPGSFVDDFGNLVTPDDNGRPSGRQSRTTPPAAAGGGLRLPFGAGLNGQMDKQFRASHNLSKEARSSHDQSEQASESYQYGVDARQANLASQGESSQQSSRRGTAAARSTTDTVGHHRDTVQRDERHLGENAAIHTSASGSSRYNFMADPQWVSQVAQRNGMSTLRFMRLPAAQQAAMARAYADETEALSRSHAMPQGHGLPATTQDLDAARDKDRGAMPSTTEISKAHRRNAAATGAGTTSALPADPSTPPLIAAAKTLVQAHRNAHSAGSLPERTQRFDEHVDAYASPDRAPGEGRANVNTLARDAAVRDAVDTGKKMFNVLRGRNATADGKELPAHVTQPQPPQVKPASRGNP